MKRIYKYQIDKSGNVEMPIGAEILTVQVQNEEVVLWAIVDPMAKTECRRFELITTGCLLECPESKRYLSTLQFNGGLFVLHLFETK